MDLRMNYDGIMSSRIQQVQPSGIRKFFDILEEMKDAISLGVGEPDFVTPWHIRDAGIYSLEKGFTKYTSNAGMAELRREIAAYLAGDPIAGPQTGWTLLTVDGLSLGWVKGSGGVLKNHLPKGLRRMAK